MSITASHSVKGQFAFVATDTRCMVGEERVPYDVGGKIISTGSGWASCTARDGGGQAAARALRVLSLIGPAAPGIDIAHRAEQLVLDNLRNCGIPAKNFHVSIVEPRSDPALVLLTDGRASAALTSIISSGGDFPEDAKTLWPVAVDRAIHAAECSLPARIQATAFHFARASQFSRVVSRTMEVGYVFATQDGEWISGFLRGDVFAIAGARAHDLLARFSATNGDKTFEERVEDIECANKAGVRLEAITGLTLIDPGTGQDTRNLTVLGASIEPGGVGPVQSAARFNAKVSNSSNQSIANNTQTVLTWNTEYYDTAALHDAATNPSRLTIPAGGDIGNSLLHATIEWDANATGYREVQIIKNGANVMGLVRGPGMSSSSLGNIQEVTAWADYPAAGDYFEVRVIQTSGGALNVKSVLSWFSLVHLW